MTDKPKIVVLGTGGTIAGTGETATSAAYTSGQFEPEHLIAAVAGLDRTADILTESLFASGSEDLGPRHWLALARRVDELTARPEVDGIVITHGTDTLEEAAFLLHLVCKSEKPVVMTAALRAATAHSADGPANIHQAVLTASDKRLAASGVVVAMNGLILPAWEVSKTHSVAIDAFAAYPGGPIGGVVGERVSIFRTGPPPPLKGSFAHLAADHDHLPEIAVLHLHGGCGDRPLRQWQESDVAGFVLAAFGAGTMPADMSELAQDMARTGSIFVVSSRVGEVSVQRETMTAYGPGILPAGVLNPAKSSILLALSLADDLPAGRIEDLFDSFSGFAGRQ